jgi:hypothetical protein
MSAGYAQVKCPWCKKKTWFEVPEFPLGTDNKHSVVDDCEKCNRSVEVDFISENIYVETVSKNGEFD